MLENFQVNKTNFRKRKINRNDDNDFLICVLFNNDNENSLGFNEKH